MGDLPKFQKQVCKFWKKSLLTRPSELERLDLLEVLPFKEKYEGPRQVLRIDIYEAQILHKELKGVANICSLYTKFSENEEDVTARIERALKTRGIRLIETLREIKKHFLVDFRFKKIINNLKDERKQKIDCKNEEKDDDDASWSSGSSFSDSTHQKLNAVT
eukprot:g1365.t1